MLVLSHGGARWGARMLLPQLCAELSPSLPSGHHSSVTSSERPFLTALHKIIQHTHTPLDLPPHSTCPVGSPLHATGSPRGAVSIWVTAVLHTEDNAQHREGPRTCLWNVPLSRQAWGPREQQPRSWGGVVTQVFSFFSFLLLQVKVPTGLGLFDEDGNTVWFVITLP